MTHAFDITLQHFWRQQGHRVLRATIVLMLVAASIWLTYEFWRLLLQESGRGAIDLRFRYNEVLAWFEGQNVYKLYATANYPPASNILLWPFMGWTTFPLARWVWAVTTVLALVWLTRIFLKESHAQSGQERLLIALCPFAAYATGAAIGNGQLIVHILPCLVMASLLLGKEREHWAAGLLAVLLFLFALVKPAVTAPFFWIFLFAAGRLWPAVLVVLGYAGLTLWAASYQETAVWQLMVDWLSGSAAVLYVLSVNSSSGSTHSLLASLGLTAWSPVVSILMLAALGVWTYRFRKIDMWILIGVAALVSRLYTYHGWYDDALILLPMISVFRILKSSDTSLRARVMAAILFAACLVFMLAPGGLYLLPHPLDRIYAAVQIVIWIAMLLFLHSCARQSGQGVTKQFHYLNIYRNKGERRNNYLNTGSSFKYN